jgi:hypothetical protein
MLIRVHLAGGAVESFTQDDPDKIRIMWQSVDPARTSSRDRGRIFEGRVRLLRN